MRNTDKILVFLLVVMVLVFMYYMRHYQYNENGAAFNPPPAKSAGQVLSAPPALTAE